MQKSITEREMCNFVSVNLTIPTIHTYIDK